MTDVLSKIRLQATGIGGRTPQPSLATDSDIVRGPAITPTASMADSMAVPAKKITPRVIRFIKFNYMFTVNCFQCSCVSIVPDNLLEVFQMSHY